MGHLYPVTASEFNDTDSTEKLLLRALILSLVLHLAVYGTWRAGDSRGWWRNLAMPKWMQLVSKVLVPAVPKKPSADLPSQTQLVFVEVDPSLATPEAPKAPKFIGARNTLAANPEIKVPSDKPNIEGRPEEYLKTTPNVKPQHQPEPATQPPPQPQIAAAPSAPRKSYVPGDLALARPSDKAQEGKSETESAAQAEPQPAYQRPRTIAEALARNGMPGEKSRQAGGVNRVRPDSALDVKGTPIGDYLQQMADAVQQRWDQLLKNQTTDTYGKVVLQFRLHPNGRVTDMKMVRNEVSNLLETTCEQAILDPAPYQPWPREMRLDVPTDYYDITFTFYYEAY
jgi:hypothetical protein